jgi:hypothetical protein
VGNNEQGFTEADVRALCDVARSTKTAAEDPTASSSGVAATAAPRIGCKGIGFKSVFALSDTPHVVSSAFQLFFDAHHASGLGLLVPLWMTPERRASMPDWALPAAPPAADPPAADGPPSCNDADANANSWGTRLWLPLRAQHVAEWERMAGRLTASISPHLLLFLNQLTTVLIRDTLTGLDAKLHRRQLADGVVEVLISRGAVDSEQPASSAASRLDTMPTPGSYRWLLHSHCVDTHGIVKKAAAGAASLRTVGDAPASTTTLKVAMPIAWPGMRAKPRDSSQAPQQYVYAFLPLCSYGLRFALHADWVIPSSREAVSSGSPWNELLRDAIPDAFTQMVLSARDSQDVRSLWCVVLRLTAFPLAACRRPNNVGRLAPSACRVSNRISTISR